MLTVLHCHWKACKNGDSFILVMETYRKKKQELYTFIKKYGKMVATLHIYTKNLKNRLCFIARRIVRSFLSARRSAGRRGASLFICVWMVLQISETHNSKPLMFFSVDRFFVLFRANDVMGCKNMFWQFEGLPQHPGPCCFYVFLVVRW